MRFGINKYESEDKHGSDPHVSPGSELTVFSHFMEMHEQGLSACGNTPMRLSFPQSLNLHECFSKKNALVKETHLAFVLWLSRRGV